MSIARFGRLKLFFRENRLVSIPSRRCLLMLNIRNVRKHELLSFAIHLVFFSI